MHFQSLKQEISKLHKIKTKSYGINKNEVITFFYASAQYFVLVFGSNCIECTRKFLVILRLVINLWLCKCIDNIFHLILGLS